MWFFLHDLPSVRPPPSSSDPPSTDATFQAIFVYWVTNNLFGLLYALFVRLAPESLRRAAGLPTKAEFERAKEVANAGKSTAGGGAKKPQSFMDGFRAMQDQVRQAQEFAQEQQRRQELEAIAPAVKVNAAAPKEIQARPLTTPPPSSSALFEGPASSEAASSGTKEERTTHGAVNEESAEGHAEAAETGSGVQVGEVPPSSTPPPSSSEEEPKAKRARPRFGKPLDEAGPV